MSRTFLARMQLYVKIQKMPPHNYQSTLSNYIVVQFNSASSVNKNPTAQNLKYHITSLKNIRVLNCSVNFSISPKTQIINFSKFNLLNIQQHNITKTFSIKTTKSQNNQCTNKFKVSSSFYTKKTLVKKNKALLISNSLKLRLLNKNASPYTFNKYAKYANFTSNMLIYKKTYTAKLSSIASTPIKAGPFNTVVLFKINYN